jgi:hypothetical protein
MHNSPAGGSNPSGKHHLLDDVHPNLIMTETCRGILFQVSCIQPKRNKKDENLKKFVPILLLGLGLSLIATSVYFILRDAPDQTDLSTVPVQTDFPSPELTLTDLEGVIRSLSDYQ